jgi:hypothetical protein
MRKRYLRLDIEYDMDEASMLRMTKNNIERILAEDMPYCTIIFSRDTSNRDALDEERYKGPKS